jgi:hypothetical protein
VASDWPTHPSPIAELAKLHLVSERGQDYDPLTIDLYIPVHPPLALVTRDKKTTDAHRQRTPKYSDPCIPEPTREPPIELPRTLPFELPPPAQPRYPPTQVTNPYYPSPIDLTTDRRPFDLPVPAQLYSPPAHIPRGRLPYGPPSPAQRDLTGLFGPASGQAQPRRSDPLTASILTAQGRSKVTPNFLNCCRLLTHHDPALILTDTNTGQPLASYANLFPRQPTEHFRRDVFGPLSTGSTANGYLPGFFNYAEALLNRQGIYGEAQYSKSFFTVERTRALYAVESWDTLPHTQDLANLPKQTFYVYSLLQCLQGLTTHLPVLSAQGISLLQAKNLGSMTELLFRMINVRLDFLTSPFDRSILGRRLAQWSKLPDNTAAHQIWHTHQSLVSYLWFSNLRDALHIMHCWIKAQRFHHGQGFLSATEATSGATRQLVTDTFPSHIPVQNTNLVEAFARYDLQFTARWYDLTRHPPPTHLGNRSRRPITSCKQLPYLLLQ